MWVWKWTIIPPSAWAVNLFAWMSKRIWKIFFFFSSRKLLDLFPSPFPIHQVMQFSLFVLFFPVLLIIRNVRNVVMPIHLLLSSLLHKFISAVSTHRHINSSVLNESHHSYCGRFVTAHFKKMFCMWSTYFFSGSDLYFCDLP